jgi:hypothetical protein
MGLDILSDSDKISKPIKFLNLSKRYLTGKVIFKLKIFERVELLIELRTHQISARQI